MLRLGKLSQDKPEEVLQKARAFFGPNGVGLALEEGTANSLRFTGAGGFVLVTAAPAEGGTDVDLQSQEWDYQIKQFLKEI